MYCLREGRVDMEKLSRILAVIDHPQSATVLLDKAVFLARCFNARVEVMVCESQAAAIIAGRCTELGYDEVDLFSAFRGADPLHELVMRRVMHTRPDLVIKDPAGRHPTRRWTLDDNDWHLADECPVPVVLVGARPWSQPVRFAAAVDVADQEAQAVTRGILQTAGMLTLGCRGNLDVLYSEREERDETLRMERAVKVAALVREFHVGCERLQIWDGKPEERLPELLAARHYDLLVLGAVTHRAGPMASMNLLTSALVDAADADVVLVKASERVVRHRENQSSAGKQRLHEQQQLA
jgi:nucleotide-binding universal stress UspA family protein